MIFNTFDSDIKDATSALDIFKKKFGLFGKSLSQWEDIRSEWKDKIDDIIDASGVDRDDKKATRKAKKEAKNQVGSFYSYNRKQRTENEVTSKFFVTKKSIQPFMQSGWFENFDNKKAQDILDKLKAQQDAIDKMGISTDSAKLKWEEYFETADESERWQKTFVKDGKLVATNLDDITIGQENAAKAAKQHDANLGKMTIGVKAANFAINAFKTALNAIAMWGIMELIQLAIKKIDDTIHRIDNAREAIENNRSAYEQTTSDIESMNSELETTKSKIDELEKKGVLTFTDKAELENLKKQNDELERSISLQEKKQKTEVSKTVAEIQDNREDLIKDFQKSKDDYEQYKKSYDFQSESDLKRLQEGSLSYEDYEESSIYLDEKLHSYESDIIAGIEEFEAYKEDLINKYNSDDTSLFSITDRELYNNIVSQLQSAYKLIYTNSEYNKFVIEPIFNQDKLKGLQDQLLQYFVSGGSTDTSALEEKFGADIITALRNACEKAGIDFNEMIEDMYSNSQSKLDQIAPMIEAPNGAYEAQQNQVSKKIRDYIQNDLSEEDRTILLNAEIPDDVKIKTTQDVDNFIANLSKEVNKPTSFSDAWESLKTTTDDKIKGLSDDLLELANKGQLTAETFKKADSTDYFKKLEISADEAVDRINALVQSSSQLSSMSSQVSAMSNALKTKSENGYVSADTLAGFDDDVKGMDSWKEFERLMGDSTSSVQECKEAAGQLASEWINSNNFLSDLNESTKEYYITQLDAMGVENAREVVVNRLLQKQKMLNAENEFAKKTGKELVDATDEEIVNFIREADCTDAVKEGIAEFILEKKLAGETKIDLIPDLEALANYVEILGYAADAIRAFDNAKKNVTEGSGSFAGAPAEAYKYLEDNAQSEFDDIKAKIRAKINGTDNISINPNGSKNSSSSSSSSNSDFDWIQVKLEAISKITDKLQKKFEKTFTVNSAAKKFKDYLSQINSEISANKTAGQTYLNYFNGVGLSSEWKNKIKSGKYKIDKNVDSATADKISEAQGYWNNYIQSLETIDQLEDERESAEDTYANKVIDHYNKQIEKQQKLLDLREKFVSIRATWSDFANTASDYRYEQSKNIEQIKTYDNAITKYRSLQKTVAQGSDAWNTYNEQIKDNQDKIQELTLSNAELSKSIMNLPLDNASKKIEKYSNNLSLLQTKYNSLNMADSKNKNIDLQQKQSANIKAANDAALKEANANLNSAWTAVRTKAYDTFKTANKKAKKGDYLTQFSSTREGYKTIVDYNNALTAQKKAYEEAEKASAEYYRTVQENTKTKWDNIINQYQTNYDYFNSKSSRASAYLDYRKSMGYSNTSIYQENAYKDQLQAQKDALAELEEERSKLDWNKIQKQYEAGELQRDDYFALAKTIKELDSSIYKAKSDINETNAAINKIPFQRLEYQIGTLTNKQTELSNALSLKQKLNEAIKAEDYTSQINTNKQLEKLYISENIWLQEQLKTVSVNSDKWKEWTDAIASNESKINSLKQSNEDLKDSLRSEVYIKPFEKMATKIDFLKERLSSFLGLVNDTDTMFDDKGAFTKNGEATLGLSLKNIDAAKLKIENIQNKIQEAQKLYNNGNNDIGYSEEEYADDMRQYISDMWNAVSESKSASDEIVKIYQEQGQAILDALNKEIDARSEALQKKKEYYDYDKTIKTKTKDIQSLETQIAAMQSMEDSLEKRKKLLELQEELNEKQEDLKDTQLDHQINIVVNGLDDFSTKIQENFDDSVKELKTNLDKQAEIINKANSLYADSYNSIFEHLSKLMKYYGIDSSKLPSDLKDTTIGNLKGFSRGGVARDLSGIIKQNGDSLLATINPNETVLTERFTELMPHAVDIMEGLIKTPVIPPSSVMQPNVNIQFNVDGNVDSVTWDTIKKEIPNISKQVQKDIYVDLKKSGALRK